VGAKINTKRIIKITDRCVGCAVCMLVCPFDGVDVLGSAEINERCNACMKCLMYCPNSAIEVKEG
jgi:Fe-S-cluster-containing hydrogenase component 2